MPRNDINLLIEDKKISDAKIDKESEDIGTIACTN